MIKETLEEDPTLQTWENLILKREHCPLFDPIITIFLKVGHLQKITEYQCIILNMGK